MTEQLNPISNRYDLVLLVDVKNGNPNGDPDVGGQPRINDVTEHGLMSDVCIKRKVRNYISIRWGNVSPNFIYVGEKAVLNKTHEKAYCAVGAQDVLAETEEEKNSKGKNSKAKKKARKGTAADAEKAQQWLCENYFDVRTFGAVMSTGVNCGQVRGPVQLVFAESIDPIIPQSHCITRMAVTTEEEAEEQSGDNRTMGQKYTVPYGLYRMHGYISAHFAEKTGFSENDLANLWEALINMFEVDRSASRGEMIVRGLYVFKHDSKLGNAPSHKLFDLIEILEGDGSPANSFADYADRIVIHEDDVPNGVELIRMVG